MLYDLYVIGINRRNLLYKRIVSNIQVPETVFKGEPDTLNIRYIGVTESTDLTFQPYVSIQKVKTVLTLLHGADIVNNINDSLIIAHANDSRNDQFWVGVNPNE